MAACLFLCLFPLNPIQKNNNNNSNNNNNNNSPDLRNKNPAKDFCW
jgi:hypothetical protein